MTINVTFHFRGSVLDYALAKLWLLTALGYGSDTGKNGTDGEYQ